jgi:hypothetical protein
MYGKKKEKEKRKKKKGVPDEGKKDEWSMESAREESKNRSDSEV